MTVLMRQEKTHVADSLNVVVERLSNQSAALTDSQVDQLLRPRNVLADETSGSDQRGAVQQRRGDDPGSR